MGCDIHLHVEIKHKEKGWLHYSAPSIDRWYLLFGRMAGVRTDEVEPISKPRGLPDDMSEMTRLCYEDQADDAHSMSWLGRDEIKILNEFIRECRQKPWENFDAKCGYLLGNSLAFEDSDRCKPEWLIDCRIVFWFDN